MLRPPIPRFHFFAWSNHYGWQHLGSTDGYMTYEECYNDNEFYIKHEGRDDWRIMELKDVEQKDGE